MIIIFIGHESIFPIIVLLSQVRPQNWSETLLTFLFLLCHSPVTGKLTPHQKKPLKVQWVVADWISACLLIGWMPTRDEMWGCIATLFPRQKAPQEVSNEIRVRQGEPTENDRPASNLITCGCGSSWVKWSSCPRCTPRVGCLVIDLIIIQVCGCSIVGWIL